VIDYGTKRALYFVGEQNTDIVQTLIDRDAPQRLQHPYTQELAAGLAYPAQPASVLLVGLGGGALVRFFNAYFPEIQLDVVEIDPAVVAVARDYFGVKPAPHTRIIVADGRDYLERAAERYDLILLDVNLYPREETDNVGHPLALRTAAFQRSLHERLRPGGAVLLNLVARGEEGATIASICRAFASADLLWTPARGNVIVAAMPAGLPDAATLRARAHALDERRVGFSIEQRLAAREPACGR
jgi:spermidine synthase